MLKTFLPTLFFVGSFVVGTPSTLPLPLTSLMTFQVAGGAWWVLLRNANVKSFTRNKECNVGHGRD
jgi:hypothetical protein